MTPRLRCSARPRVSGGCEVCVNVFYHSFHMSEQSVEDVSSERDRGRPPLSKLNDGVIQKHVRIKCYNCSTITPLIIFRLVCSAPPHSSVGTLPLSTCFWDIWCFFYSCGTRPNFIDEMKVCQNRNFMVFWSQPDHSETISLKGVYSKSLYFLVFDGLIYLEDIVCCGLTLILR